MAHKGRIRCPNRRSAPPAVRLSDKAARSLQLAIAAARTAEENRGRDIVVLDVRKLTRIFDYFVIATGTSRRQLHAMSEEIDHKLEDDLGDKRMGIEGYAESRWILLDYGTMVIHLFDDETRKYFALEELWAEAPRVEWQADSGHFRLVRHGLPGLSRSGRDFVGQLFVCGQGC